MSLLLAVNNNNDKHGFSTFFIGYFQFVPTDEDERTARTTSTNTLTTKITISTTNKTTDVVILVAVVPICCEQQH